MSKKKRRNNKINEAWVEAHAAKLAESTLKQIMPELIKAMQHMDHAAFTEIIRRTVIAAFHAGVVGTIYLQNEFNDDFSALIDDPSYQKAKKQFGERDAFSE